MKATGHPGIHGEGARIISLYQDNPTPISTAREKGNRIALPTVEGIHLIEIRRIMYCRADGNYTHLHLTDEHQMIISKTLGALDQLLSSRGFMRVHQSYLVQVDMVACLQPDQLIMDTGLTIPVARSRRMEVRNRVIRTTHNHASISEFI